MKRTTEAKKRLEEASETLRTLSTPGEGCPGRDSAYFEAKWMAQRTRQLDAMTERQQAKRDKIALLLGLEEGLHVTLARLAFMEDTDRRARTQAERNELLALPRTVADIEDWIDAVAIQLGGAEFQNILGAQKNQKTALVALSVARGCLYEAKVGVIESRLRRHRSSGDQRLYVFIQTRPDAYAISATRNESTAAARTPV
ncbi:uncharacterized protein MELLADRAFT_94705 [Melampsora larici-populina 98AG31]|uniref:Uncharacterized protein n=1 Tax=Melampsora larici-populina (strain 98AG31 / pathotype 3-4-7) TaxID=747676 RepID=F4S7N4_MELLP|nr:uncharacterized protein MELLADRAFT_94705 [Melampsora larici-populina 98AG31]EGF99351.1 hypothetical protein MELLADRAFT_94705 [Melampsora larici-populina 98AG31]